MDIVYIYKATETNDELRYSLRTVEKNFPHDRVIIHGECPGDIVPDIFIPFKQIGQGKWQKTGGALKDICSRNEISDDFVLFNDDFFIMHPANDFGYFYTGELIDRINTIEKRNNGHANAYTTNLRITMNRLIIDGLTCKCYDAMHRPMMFNKERALITFEEYPNVPMFQTVYGNRWNVGGVLVGNCKIKDIHEEPDPVAVYLSTSNGSFERGKVGEYIREMFPERSRFEADGKRIF